MFCTLLARILSWVNMCYYFITKRTKMFIWNFGIWNWKMVLTKRGWFFSWNISCVEGNYALCSLLCNHFRSCLHIRVLSLGCFEKLCVWRNKSHIILLLPQCLSTKSFQRLPLPCGQVFSRRQEILWRQAGYSCTQLGWNCSQHLWVFKGSLHKTFWKNCHLIGRNEFEIIVVIFAFDLKGAV